MRGVLCDSKYKELLAQFAKTSKLSIGLIIGQSTENGKDLVVHLAKTQHSEQKSEVEQGDGEKGEEEEAQVTDELTKVSDIKNKVVAEHALNAIRMTVGGFEILGVFVVSEKNLTDDGAALQKIKTVMMDIKSTLASNNMIYPNIPLQAGSKEQIFLNYIAGHKNYICKTISMDASEGPSASPVDWKFVSKPAEFHEFEATYEIATAFPLPHTNNQFDTEKYIMGTIDTIVANLTQSVMFFNGSPSDPELTVEQLMKNFTEEESQKVKVTIYSDASNLATNQNGVLTPHESMVRYTGIVTSRVYGAPRNTIKEIESYIAYDIMRTITTRLQIYYDALLANDDGGNEDETERDQEVNSTCPPRRVFFPIGNSTINFCDYLFQNENEETTVKQSFDILGLELDTAAVEISVEAAIQCTAPEKADLVEGEASDGSCSGDMMASEERGKMIIIVGVAGLIVAIIATLIMKYLLLP